MTLIKSISGIRGIIGGEVGDSLSPLDIVRFTASYATFIKKQGGSSNTIIIPLLLVVMREFQGRW